MEHPYNYKSFALTSVKGSATFTGIPSPELLAAVNRLAELAFKKSQAFPTYTYRGDKFTDPKYKGATCKAVRTPGGKCIRGRNGNMLVKFAGGTTAVVLARQLRKIKPISLPS